LPYKWTGQGLNSQLISFKKKLVKEIKNTRKIKLRLEKQKLKLK